MEKLFFAMIKFGENSDLMVGDTDSLGKASLVSSVAFVPLSSLDLCRFLLSKDRDKPFLIRLGDEQGDDDPGTDRLVLSLLCCLL